MATRVAVVTDALSPDFIFPYWYSYYGGLFGTENLFLLTYAGLAGKFSGFKLGGIIQLPLGFEDQMRAATISSLVSALLPSYNAVIRVDADEFLVVDPREGCNLAGYIETMPVPYLTARGFDVLQLPHETPLDATPGQPILTNRTVAYPNTALNKTCIVKVPVSWSTGFHWSNVYPKFGPVFMLHMKRIDIDWQLSWYRTMTENIADNAAVTEQIKQYYSPGEEKIRNYYKNVGAYRNRLQGIESWYREALMNEYLGNLALHQNGTYRGKHGHENNVLCEIVPEWKPLI